MNLVHDCVHGYHGDCFLGDLHALCDPDVDYPCGFGQSLCDFEDGQGDLERMSWSVRARLVRHEHEVDMCSGLGCHGYTHDVQISLYRVVGSSDAHAV